MATKNISPEIKNTFQWLLSELWEVLILSSIGEYDYIEEKVEKVLLFIKEHGISESSMALEEDINNEALVNLVNKFKQEK